MSSLAAEYPASMNPNSYLRVNSPDVVHETFDDEAVVLHLGTGNYYSLNDAGKIIWEYLQGGRSVAAVFGAANGHSAEVERFVCELLEEGLMVEAGPAQDMGARVTLPDAAPALRRYTDMQALFLVDPIHEVQDSGWPQVPRDADSPS